jgi:pyridoxine kinase
MRTKRLPRVLAIHDLCVYGRCSLSVISPVLSARGVQCCPLPTALFSAPTNYEGNFSLTLPGRPILQHLISLETGFDAIYSGFLAGEEQAGLVEEAFEAFPDALRVVDPVLGDSGKLYRTMNAGMVKAVRRLAGKAHLITPNVTEAAILLGETPSGKPSGDEESKEWLSALAQGRSVVMTGLSCGGDIGIGWTEHGKTGLFRHPRTEGGFHGTGDLFAAYLLAELLYGAPLASAAGSAAGFVSGCTELTAANGADPKEGLLFEPLLRNP